MNLRIERVNKILEGLDSEIDSEGNIVPNDLRSKLRDSKIRNRKGCLKVCYHGTNAEFKEFKEEFIASSSGNIGWFGKGFYFTDSTKLASSYGSKLRKAYLNIKKPFIYSSEDSIYTLLSLGIKPRVYNNRLQPYAYVEDAQIEEFTEAIKKAGYDGVIFSYKQGKYKPNIKGVSSSYEYVCFNANQIIDIE